MTINFKSLLNRTAPLSRCLLAGACGLLAQSASALSIPQRSYHPGMRPRSLLQDNKSLSPGYLAMAGPVSLRFAPPPAEAEERPVRIVEEAPQPSIHQEPTPELPTPEVQAEPEPAKTEPTPASTSAKPVTILPDDTPRDLKAEDVLPFFQMPADPNEPGTASVVVPFTPAVPNSTTLPPSSATYQLK